MAIEFLKYIAPDAEEYEFHVPSPRVGRWVVSQSGWGTPPIEHITQRGPFQHGETVKDYFLRPRTIQLLIRQEFCDRKDWWDGRGNLLDYIRPNRQLTPTAAEPGQLILITSNNEERALDVFIAEGPRFEPRRQGIWDEWSFQEVLRFVAFNPAVYDPTEVAIAEASGIDEELVFPITFDVPGLVEIRFGRGNIDLTPNINYTGTWESLPIIEIRGPLDNPIIDNVTTGEKVELAYNVPPYRTVTIDLRYGYKTVQDDLGNNLIGTVTTDSDLATFHIAPNPEAPLGVNAMRFRGNNANSATLITLRYYTRYYGI